MNMTRFQRFLSANVLLRRFGFSFPLFLLLFLMSARVLWADGAVPTALISETQARAAGLTRPWFNQVTMDPQHDRVTHVTLQDDTLFVTSDNGWIHVIDTNTGNTLWTRRIGSRKFYSLPPAANSFAVAVVHGSDVHVYDRFDGKKLLQFQVHGPAGGGPQIGERFIYVPILTGKIFAYPLIRAEQRKLSLTTELGIDAKSVVRKDPRRELEEAKEIADSAKIEKKVLVPFSDTQVQVCPALGEPLVQPFICSQTPDDDYFSWVTTSGDLMIGNLNMNKSENALKLLYSVKLAPQSMFIDNEHFKEVSLGTQSDINTRPTFVQKDITDVNTAKGDAAKGGLILMGAQSGYVFAVNDISGTSDWTFPVGRAVTDPIGVADDNCFVPTFTGHFYCLNIKNGQLLWSINDIKQFVSATKSRLYALDMLGNLLVINRENGQTIHSIPLTTGMHAVFNIESDRIFLVGADGLVQCLHEAQFDQVQRYQQSSIERARDFQERIQSVAQEREPAAEKKEISQEEKAELDRKMFGDDEDTAEDADADVTETEDAAEQSDNSNAADNSGNFDEDEDDSNPFE